MTLDFNLLAAPRPRRRLDVLMALGVTTVLILALCGWTYALTQHLSRLRADVALITHDVSGVRLTAQHVRQLSQEVDRLRPRVAALQQADAAQVRVSQLLELVRSALPADIWLTGVSARPGDVTLDGYTASYPSIARLMIMLESSGALRHVRLLTSQTELLMQQPVVKFRVTADLAGTQPQASRTEPAP